jgi:catechol 2,3-dioxygenase-like lactoylglutathione lyase family enzyme
MALAASGGSSTSASPPARLFGPLISAGDLDAHVRLFTDVFGMVEAGRTRLGRDSSQALFGADAGAVVLVVLQTPGVHAGALLARFDAVSAETIRTYASRVDRDALKVIDFYAPDYEAALSHARRLGYEVVEAQAEYELDGGTFREAHLWGPDHVVTAFLGGPASFFADFAQVTDRLVSEVQSISAPVSQAQPVIDYYRAVFGWDVVYEYAIDDPSFAALVGVDELKLRSRNVGVSTREPYLGLIDYGLPDHVGGSLKGRCVAPRRGLLGAVITATDGDGVLARAGVAASVEVDVAPFGRVRLALLQPPHEVPHLVVSPIATS